MNIGTEEISHLEVVGALIGMHLNPQKKTLDKAEMDPLLAVTGGGGISLYNSAGSAWTADYLKISGELDVDLRNNIAAEARAKITYEQLMHLTDDRGTRDALQLLMTREITHLKAFSAALDSLGQDRFQIRMLPPTPGIVDEYYNDSTGSGSLGKDGVGSWIGLYGLKVADTPAILKSIASSEADNLKLAEDVPNVKMQVQIPGKAQPSTFDKVAAKAAEANGTKNEEQNAKIHPHVEVPRFEFVSAQAACRLSPGGWLLSSRLAARRYARRSQVVRHRC